MKTQPRLFIGLLGIAALTLACWQMSERYLFPQIGSVWLEECTIYLIAWATFLGVPTLVHDDKHVRADVLVRLTPSRTQRLIEIANCLLGFVFAGTLTWFGYLVAADAFTFDERSVTGSAFPIWIFYASLPVGMLFSAFWYMRRIKELVFDFDANRFSVRSGHDA